MRVLPFSRLLHPERGAPTLCVVDEGGPSIGLGYPVDGKNCKRAMEYLCQREGSSPKIWEVELDRIGKVEAWVFTQKPDIPDDPVAIAR